MKRSFTGLITGWNGGNDWKRSSVIRKQEKEIRKCELENQVESESQSFNHITIQPFDH